MLSCRPASGYDLGRPARVGRVVHGLRQHRQRFDEAGRKRVVMAVASYLAAGTEIIRRHRRAVAQLLGGVSPLCFILVNFDRGASSRLRSSRPLLFVSLLVPFRALESYVPDEKMRPKSHASIDEKLRDVLAS